MSVTTNLPSLKPFHFPPRKSLSRGETRSFRNQRPVKLENPGRLRLLPPFFSYKFFVSQESFHRLITLPATLEKLDE